MVGSVGNRGGLTRLRGGVAGLALCFMAASCTAGGGVELPVTLEVQDGWIREPGSECAGSRPFLYVHAGAPFHIESSSEERVVADGSLPGGIAVEASREDLEVSRVPTFCRFRFSVPVREPGDYRFVLDEGAPLEFSIDNEQSEVGLIIP